MTHSGEARPFRLMVLALLYLLLAYWELIARGSMSASWWAFFPMMLANWACYGIVLLAAEEPL